MKWSDIPFQPSRTMLRQFAWLWLLFFSGLAAYQYFVRGNTTAAAVLGVLAWTVGPLGLVRPEWLRPIYVGWMVLAFPIGWTISQIMLAAMYFGLFTPVSLVFRAIGRDALQRRTSTSPAPATYWTAKTTPTDVRRYLKQF